MKIPVGIKKGTSEIVLIDNLSEDERGLKCNCVCPECQLATKTDPPLARKIDPPSSFIF